LLDMEMVQFHPTGMVWPPGVRGILVTEGVRGEGGLLYNAKNERFMLEYDPQRKELSSRDVVARSIWKEVQAGRGTPHGGAWLDITHKGAAFVKKKLPGMYEQFRALADVDITKERFEVGPTIHYTMGGIKVDPETGATNVPGLYAAGECASGLHGANRLGGNSLGDLLVFGRRAGAAAAAFAQGRGAVAVDDDEVRAEAERVLKPFALEGGENPFRLHEALQEVMAEHLGIARNGPSLEEGLKKIVDLKERARTLSVSGARSFNPGWHAALDVGNMLDLCEAIVRGALARKESRGAQWRTDFPDENDAEYRVNFVQWKDRDGYHMRTDPVPEMPAGLAQLFELGQAPGLARAATQKEGAPHA
jgi:succinate dehydrogenase / fumarate reductase flavoprotein subunit